MKISKKYRNYSKQSTVKNIQTAKMKHIRSMYIVEIILSHLKENKKFSIIKYNKRIQNHLELNIEDYKRVSGRYIIGERNGKGKEYLLENNKLIYDGEYIEGKRHGKGKEFDNLNGAKIFEGNYLNGKRNGEGKEYFINGKLKFEGEYKNGIMWNGNGYNIDEELEFELKKGKGKIKEYDYYGILEFEGEYKDGKRNKNGIEYNKYGELEFEGEYLNGERQLNSNENI